ncbi:MAG: hydrogenase expression/formation protein HypE [Deltaproteobacteria bacterium]|nr:MAG: hydrogenase expression/formation protein HypE [Deltaproteobacteria bacterium]
MKNKTILLDHGSGGLAGQELISGLFLKHLGNPVLSVLEDSAVIETGVGRLAFTTDSFVVDPVFFPGGDIGSLAVHGTINDLAMRGARPLCLSLGMILEEGLSLADLELIVISIKESSEKAGVPVVTGDTKVVPKGKGDKVFINTSGIGTVPDRVTISAGEARPGDIILLSGTIADHGVTILTRRAGISIKGDLKSDTMALHRFVQALVEALPGTIHTLRDPTRGGMATALCEIAKTAEVGMEIEESGIPIRPEVEAACELLGLDPLYLASEGKCLAFVAPDRSRRALDIMRSQPEGKDASIIGVVTKGPAGRVVLKTAVGGARMVESLSGEPLPRIC